jgi:RNA polymerase sigma-70 factor (ECF subfamily)
MPSVAIARKGRSRVVLRMDEAELHDHLSRISTRWTMLVQAHGRDAGVVRAAQSELMQRYSGALYRYLLKVLRHRDAADEVFQEFALKFVRGDFRHADPGRGRFRDYLKVSVLRLVSSYRRRACSHAAGQAPLEQAASEETPQDVADRQFAESCREELLSRAWRGLQAFEDQTGQPYHAVLDFRSRNPEITSDEAAVRLTGHLAPSRPFTSDGLRKLLQRAREKFSELLLYEVRQIAESDERETVEETLIDLGLIAYCRPALEQRYAGAG